MADPESSDVLANLPTGRPTRRSSHRGEAGDGAETAASATAAKSAPGAKSQAGPKAPAKRPAAKSAAAAKPKTAATKAKATTAKATTAKAPAAKKAPAKSAAKPAAAAKAASKVTTAAKPAAAKTPAKPTAKTPGQAATPRRARIATPTEGRRADFSAGSAQHRARKVTTNRPWLPSSGFALPDSKDRPQLGMAIEGLAAALGDVARLSIGIAQSLTVRRKSDELEPPTESETPEPTKS